VEWLFKNEKIIDKIREIILKGSEQMQEMIIGMVDVIIHLKEAETIMMEKTYVDLLLEHRSQNKQYMSIVLE
jgi:hypothetical protein